MKTAERILDEALDQLNTSGPANVTTNGIADGTNISVGNLYYHFKNKEEIVLVLVKQFLSRASELLDSSSIESNVDSIDDWVSWWDQWFDLSKEYKFLFHHQTYLTENIGRAGFYFQKLASRVEIQQRSVFESFKAKNILVATFDDVRRLAREVTFIAFFWQDFYRLLHSQLRAVDKSDQAAMTQILGLLLPYLRAADQLQVEQLMARTSS